MNDQLWDSIEKKIIVGNFNFSSNEKIEILDRSSNKFYNFSTIVYKLLDNSNYTLDNWKDLTNFFYDFQFRSSLISHWYERTVIHNLWRSLWKDKGKKSEESPALIALKALVIKSNIINNKKALLSIKTNLASSLSLRPIEPLNIFEKINYLSPDLFSGTDAFVAFVFKVAGKSPSLFEACLRIIPFSNKKLENELVKKVEHLILHRATNTNNKRILFKAIKEDWVVEKLKNSDKKIVENISSFFSKSEFKEIEADDFKPVKHLIKLDKFFYPESSHAFVIEIQENFINKIYRRRVGHKLANKQKMVSFLRSIPGASPKLALYQLSKLHKNEDINYLSNKFPELAKLTLLT
jgi:hypothetical protein